MGVLVVMREGSEVIDAKFSLEPPKNRQEGGGSYRSAEICDSVTTRAHWEHALGGCGGLSSTLRVPLGLCGSWIMHFSFRDELLKGEGPLGSDP